MPTLALDDATLHYRIDGDADAPPLLLAHALAATIDLWEPQLAVLARDFRVIRYDARGHGASSVPPGPLSIAQLGRDALALLDHLGVARTHFCGVSMGGLVGQWLAIHAPDRVGRVVLANTAAKIGTADLWNARIDAIAQAAAGTLPSGIVDGVVERWFTPRFRTLAPTRVAAIRATIAATSPAGYAACCAAIRDADLHDGLASVRAPVLVIAGAHDPSTPPARGREIAATVPGAAYVELDCAHIAGVEEAGGFNAALVAFLTDGAVTEASRATIGEGMRRAVLGDAHVDRSAASRTAFNGEFLDFITRTAWGETWTRPGLPRHARSLLTIGMLVALDRSEELALHLNAARNNGVTRDEIKEVLLHAAVYCGVPAANAAFRLAARVFAEQDGTG